MNNKSQWIERLIIFTVCVLAIMDGVLYSRVRAGIDRFAQSSESIYRLREEHSAISPPDGFTVTGAREIPKWLPPSGWAVRYASNNCGYCKQDEARWTRMATELRRLNFQIVTVVPESRDAYPANAEALKQTDQIVFVDIGWLKNFRLDKTPTLLIFDPRHGLIWSHRGVLETEDQGSAMRTIKKWANRN